MPKHIQPDRAEFAEKIEILIRSGNITEALAQLHRAAEIHAAVVQDNRELRAKLHVAMEKGR